MVRWLRISVYAIALLGILGTGDLCSISTAQQIANKKEAPSERDRDKALAQSPGNETSAIAAPPMTQKIPVSDVYHGVTVIDDYRWLENGDNPQVKAWVAQQNAYSQAYLSKLPQHAPIIDYLKKTRQKMAVQYFPFKYAGGRLFALKIDPAKSGWSFVAFNSPEDKASERTVVARHSR